MSEKKRKTSWNPKYATEFGFIKKVDNDESKAYCSICSTQFSIAFGGRRDITQHTETKRHKSALEAGSSSKKLSDYFRNIQASKDEMNLAAKESTLAFHTAMHNISFRSNDCTASLLKYFFESKLSLGRTKTKALIRNVIAPYIDNIAQEVVSQRKFAAIMTDTSNHKNLKMLPVVVRVFDPMKGVINWKATITEIPNEQSLTVSNILLEVINKLDLKDKVIAYSADNTNLNFGGAARNGVNNVWRKLQDKLNRNLIGNGCFAHIIHNSISAGCEILEIDIEAVIVKIFKHFSIYTVRTEKFKSLCDEIDQVFKPLLNHSCTRFLSLEPAVLRLLELFEPLKEYFQSLKNCAPSIKRFFENPASKFWALFISNQLKNFNESIRFMESSNITAFEIANQITILKDKLTNRQRFSFLPRESLLEYQKLDTKLQDETKKKVFDFYGTILDYLNLWENSLDGTQVLTWMLMYKCPTWADIEETIEFAIEKYGEKFKEIVDRDLLFDEFCLLNSYAEQHVRSWLDSKLSSENVWIKIFSHFRENSTRLINMEKVAEFAFCLAGTSTEVERIFSLMNNIWDDNKSRMDTSTVNSLLSIQYNSKMNCLEFFERIKNDHVFLKNAISGEKYNKS